MEIVPAILATWGIDHYQLAAQMQGLLATGVQRIHVDVLNGRLLSGVTAGRMVVQLLRPLAASFGATIEVHLSVTQPAAYAAAFRQAGADLIIIDAHADPQFPQTLATMEALGIRTGLALQPATPLRWVAPFLPQLEQVLVTFVRGFKGHGSVAATLKKLIRLRGLLREQQLEQVTLAVDGGVDDETVPLLAQAGAARAVTAGLLGEQDGAMREQLVALRHAALAPLIVYRSPLSPGLTTASCDQ